MKEELLVAAHCHVGLRDPAGGPYVSGREGVQRQRIHDGEEERGGSLGLTRID